MNEADTCRTYVLPKLTSAGWDDEYITEQMVLTRGRIVPIGDRHTRKEGLRPDYVLFIRQNIPIARPPAATQPTRHCEEGALPDDCEACLWQAISATWMRLLPEGRNDGRIFAVGVVFAE